MYVTFSVQCGGIDWILMSSVEAPVEVLTSKVTVFGGGSFGS